jgi:hypothetical protein
LITIMDKVQVLLHTSYNNTEDYEDHVIEFQPLSDEFLPFPLNLKIEWRIIIVFSHFFNLIWGTKLKLNIFQYMKSRDANLGPINFLIWIDQINGTFFSASIISRILSLLLPFSVSSIFGERFCNSLFYLSGLYTGVNFINILCANFLYECQFGSFSLVTCT